MLHRHCLSVVLFALLAAVLVESPVNAQEPVPLISGKDPLSGWKFNNGAEFPGATGELVVDAEAKRDGKPSLKLVGDFTKGGGYVEAGRKIEGFDIRELSMWIRSPGADRLTLRINDASGQTHQINLVVKQSDERQKIVLPLEAFFARRGETDAVTGIAKYESWGGAKDGAWHGPATAIYLLLGNPRDNKVHTLWLSDIAILPKPAEVPGAEITASLPIAEILEGAHDWQFTRGEEFPGAKGSLSVVAGEPAAGKSCLKLAGDFTAGGAYVAAVKSLKELGVKDIAALKMQVKSDNSQLIGVQLVDASGQTHQQKAFKIKPDGKWHDVVIKPTEIAGGEHWGGANDGKWHGPLGQIALSVSAQSDEKLKQPVVYLADLRADALLSVFVQPPAFKSDFEQENPLQGWNTTGRVSLDTKNAAQGERSLFLSRTLETVEKPCTLTSPAFTVAPGQWEISLHCKSELHSPDNSYSGVVDLECLGSDGQIVERFTVADVFGTHDWQRLTKRVNIPKTATSAHFQARLNKTYGQFWLDDLAASYLAPPARKDDRIARVLFETAQLGNLLLPDDPRKFNITVETRKALRDDQHAISYVVRDYWGAEQMQPAVATLGKSTKTGDHFAYQATIDLADVPIEIGRYYELHAAIPQAGEEPFRNYTSFAILPEAETKRFKPAEVPFTSRNWDNRLTEYIRLTDRLGVRVCGIWGGWSPKAPYKAEAPNLELCQQLGMGWLTNTPIAGIELGKREYDDEALRQGVRNLIEQYGKVRPMYINLGNEPHGTGERVLANVAAYKIVYEEIKKVDPSIPVIATSVEPNEEYFKAGYGKWCDAFDFHIYEDSENVRRTIGEYRELMKKYGVEKPIWSTELGLNSQGQTRLAVAAEVTKKFATFFAAGGANASWFGLLYPDGEGKLHGTSGDSHNVFDCRFNRYAPRLDAIAYYNAVNAIAIKRFIAEQHYSDGVRAFLFRDRDNRNLQIMWSDKGSRYVGVPLPGIKEVQTIRVDGSRRTLKTNGEALTLSVSADPLLLLYDGAEATLTDLLQRPIASMDASLTTASHEPGIPLRVQFQSGQPHEVELLAPPFWEVKKSQSGPDKLARYAAQFTLTRPKSSSVREADCVVVVKNSQGHTLAELYHRAVAAD